MTTVERTLTLILVWNFVFHVTFSVTIQLKHVQICVNGVRNRCTWARVNHL